MIFATAPYDGTFAKGTSWYEWDGTSFTKVGGTTDDAQLYTYEHFLVMLPTGELLHTQDNYISGTLQIVYAGPGNAPTAIPEILDEPELVGSGAEPPTAPIPTIYKGRSYTMPMARMNGIDSWGVLWRRRPDIDQFPDSCRLSLCYWARLVLPHA